MTFFLLASLWSGSAHQAPDVVFVATPVEIAGAMLNLAGVTDSDVVYDLGSGDGRIVIAAAKQYGARAIGIEIDSGLVAQSRRSADSAGVSALAEFQRADLFGADLREATVVTLYLGRMLNERLKPLLFRDLRPGTRVVSQNFDMGDWAPDSLVLVRGRNFAETPVHLWVMPADVAGTWEVSIEGPPGGTERLELRLSQRYQELTGTVTSPGRRVALRSPALRADRLAFELVEGGRTRSFEGRVVRDSASGTTSNQDGKRGAWRAIRQRPPHPKARRPSSKG